MYLFDKTSIVFLFVHIQFIYKYFGNFNLVKKYLIVNTKQVEFALSYQEPFALKIVVSLLNAINNVSVDSLVADCIPTNFYKTLGQVLTTIRAIGRTYSNTLEVSNNKKGEAVILHLFKTHYLFNYPCSAFTIVSPIVAGDSTT